MSKNPFEKVTPIGKGREYRIKDAKKEGRPMDADKEEVNLLLDNIRKSRKYDLVLVQQVTERLLELKSMITTFEAYHETEAAEEYKEMKAQLKVALEEYEKRV